MKKVYGASLFLLMALAAGCGGGRGDWRTVSLERLEDQNCFENAGVVTCDVRGCAADCKVYIERNGEFLGVVGFCPDVSQGHTVAFENTFSDSVEIFCRRGRGDEAKFLGQTEDSGAAAADPNAIEDFGKGTGLEGGSGGISSTTPPPAALTLAAMSGSWKASSFKVTDLSTGQTQDAAAFFQSVTLNFDAAGQVQFGFSKGAEGGGVQPVLQASLAGAHQMKISNLRDEAFDVSLSGAKMTWTHMPFDGDGVADIVWEKVSDTAAFQKTADTAAQCKVDGDCAAGQCANGKCLL